MTNSLAITCEEGRLILQNAVKDGVGRSYHVVLTLRDRTGNIIALDSLTSIPPALSQELAQISQTAMQAIAQSRGIVHWNEMGIRGSVAPEQDSQIILSKEGAHGVLNSHGASSTLSGRAVRIDQTVAGESLETVTDAIQLIWHRLHTARATFAANPNPTIPDHLQVQVREMERPHSIDENREPPRDAMSRSASRTSPLPPQVAFPFIPPKGFRPVSTRKEDSLFPPILPSQLPVETTSFSAPPAAAAAATAAPASLRANGNRREEAFSTWRGRHDRSILPGLTEVDQVYRGEARLKEAVQGLLNAAQRKLRLSQEQIALRELLNSLVVASKEDIRGLTNEADRVIAAENYIFSPLLTHFNREHIKSILG